jgi:hypothetical protein
MPGMGETLTGRIGPLPVWAWAGIGTAGLGLFLYERNKKAAASQATANNTIGSTSGTVTVPATSNYTGSQQWTPLHRKDNNQATSQPTTLSTTAPITVIQGSTPNSDSLQSGTAPAVPDASDAGSGVSVPATNTPNA